MITIKEMANMLDLSTTTVSNVIHGKTSEVSKSTVEKVQKMLEEYEYIPNISARNLASNKSNIIGVGMVINRKGHINYLKDAFIGELIGSIEMALKSSGYHMMLYFSYSEEELIKTAASWNADGLILFGMVQNGYEIIQKKYKKPIVFVDSYVHDIRINGINIGLDDRRGGRLVGEYLLSQGHTQIAYMADNCLGCDYERFYGLISALQDSGLDVGAEIFIELLAEEFPLDVCLERSFKKVMQYTAVFCASDYYALMLMNFLRDKGVRVPEDISIVGFDDNVYASMSRPAITTIHQNPTEKGRLAVKYLLDKIDKKPIRSNWVVLPVELIKRDTVKNIK